LKPDLRIQPGQLDQAARDALTVCFRHDTTGGLADVDEVCRGGLLFEMRDAADQVALRYVLRPITHAHGKEIEIAAAVGGAAGLDLTELGLKAILHQAEGVDLVSCITRRKGLIKKLASAGFTVGGFVMQRRMRPCQ
jgi:hypothetical protein